MKTHDFACPKCGGSTWGTLDASTVTCHSDADGTPLSLREGEPINAARQAPCGWRGQRHACGLEKPPCEHAWHYYGTVNGKSDYGCQLCGATRQE